MRKPLMVLAAMWLLVGVASAQSEPCAAAWTSWGAVQFVCETGQTCATRYGERIEVLHVNEQAGKAYVRDLDKKACVFMARAPQDVVYSTGKWLRHADCTLPLWQVAEDYARFPEGCYARSIVVVLSGGLLTVVSPAQ